MHKSYCAIAAVHIAYLIIHAGIAHIKKSLLRFIESIEKLGFPKPFTVKIIRHKNCRVVPVECKFVFFHRFNKLLHSVVCRETAVHGNDRSRYETARFIA